MWLTYKQKTSYSNSKTLKSCTVTPYSAKLYYVDRKTC